MTIENRKHTRLALNFKATLAFGDGERHAGNTMNMSFGGAYIHCAPLPNTEKFENCTLELHLPGGAQAHTIPIKCRIVRSDAQGVGIQFIAIDINDYQEFKKIMIYNSPDPTTLMTELEEDPGLAIATLET